MQKARGHPKAPAACKQLVSGSISLPFEGSFHLSFTVLVHYRSLDIFSLTGWFRQIHTKFHMFRATQDTTSSSPTNIRDYHPLWLNFPDRFC
jgi:hypothetical protein